MRASEYILSKILPYGNKTAQVDAQTRRKITFDEVRGKSRALTRWLQAHNFGCGNTIGVMSKNSVDFAWIFLGILDSGAACHLIDFRYTSWEVTHALNTAPVDLLVLQKGILKTISSSKTDEINYILEFGDDDLELSENAISLDEVFKVTSFSDKMDVKSNSKIDTDRIIGISGGNMRTNSVFCKENIVQKYTPVVPAGVALIMSSSGTTGLPKGVMFTHDNIVHGLKYCVTSIEKNENVLGYLPFHHMYGLTFVLMCLCKGSTLVTMSKFSLPNWIKFIKEFSIPRLHLVPSLLVTLIKSDVIDFENLNSVRHIYAGGAPINAENLNKLKRRFPQPVDVHILYGLTEFFHTVFGSICDPKKPGLLGRIRGPTKVKIIDVKTEELLGANLAGEICIKGPSVMKGYINNPEATANAIDEDGWLRTGDLGYFDEDGYIYFVDRIKQIIKYQGHQVSPSELEFVLISHPQIKEAAVFGVEHDIFGQVPRAFIVLNENTNITAQEIHDYMRGMVAPFKLLRGGLAFISSIPKMSSGKIQRRILNTMKPDQVFYDQNLKRMQI